jgi:hypothetical protein
VDSSSDELGDIFARELYVTAGIDPTRPPGSPRVAAALLGDAYLRAVPHNQLPGNALLRQEGLRWVISVRETLTAKQLNHAIAHELGEWFLRIKGYTEPDIEELSGRVAAAICVRRSAFLVAYAKIGNDVAALSRLFRVTQSLMVLRVAECSGTPTALVTRRVVRTRGKPWAWPNTRRGWVELVKQAQAHVGRVRAHQLSDAHGRVALIVD